MAWCPHQAPDCLGQVTVSKAATVLMFLGATKRNCVQLGPSYITQSVPHTTQVEKAMYFWLNT